VLRGTFENYASDEGLGPDHWFWDRTKSGGIFIEHGVHFFDMFAGWLGVGTVESAGRVRRPESGIEEQVLLHRSVRRCARDVLSWLHTSGSHGPSGAASPLRAWRRDAGNAIPRMLTCRKS
jgi:predicted dehydrogenase